MTAYTHRTECMLDRRGFIGAAGGAMASIIAGPACAARRRPPNFILILCDDLGYGDIAPYGNRLIRTPALSRLAAEGITLTDYYAPHNICTQSRAGFLTGRYPIRAGIPDGAIEPGGLTNGLRLSDVTIAEALKPAYATGYVGKWHLGHGPAFWPPNRQGFDYFYGIPYSHDMAPLSVYESRSAARVDEHPVDFPNLQTDFCARAERFVTDNRDRPFFLQLALSSPHLPNFPDRAHAYKSRAGLFGDVVEEIDTIVGRIVALVDRLGLAGETMIAFTSDNGPWFEGSSGPLRERKASGGYDGGFRVPFIARMPGSISKGLRSDALASGLDMLPTLCAMAGVALPAGVKIDGLDISGVLTRGAPTPHDQLILFNADDVVGIRTQRWSYVAATYFQGQVMNLETRGYPQLYDMAADVSQNYSVASRHLDVVRDMKARLARARAEFEPLRTRPTRIFTPQESNVKPAIFD